ncbi:TPA: hypothetical protein EYP13_01630 [Candidatus Micrarchaeota archaeon]|nr:hypothetical protein [Candidatus Micrarchaeota archaeon]
MYGDGLFVLDEVSFPHGVYREGGADVYIRNSEFGSVRVRTRGNLVIEGLSVTSFASLIAEGSGALVVRDSNFPGHLHRDVIEVWKGVVFGANNGYEFNGVLVEGRLLGVGPEACGPDAFCVVESPEQVPDVHSLYLGVLSKGDGVLSGVSADYLAVGAEIDRIEDSSIAHMYDIPYSFPDLYRTELRGYHLGNVVVNRDP